MANIEAHVKFHENLLYRIFLEQPPSILNYVYVKNIHHHGNTSKLYFTLISIKPHPEQKRLPFLDHYSKKSYSYCVLMKRGRGEQTRVLSRLCNGQIILDDN